MKKYEPNGTFRIMSRDEVRAVDAWAINDLNIPGVVLMENAGRSCAELALRQLAGIEQPKVCIFCGTGNNGGDGYVIARHLINNGIEVRVALCGNRDKVRGDAKINLDILTAIGGSVEMFRPDDKAVVKLSQGCDLIVDALFGTGLNGTVRDDYLQLVESINARNIPILAVDIPSGLDCDTGKPSGTAIRAKWTVTFAAVKKGFAENRMSTEFTGDIYVASIGVEPGN